MSLTVGDIGHARIAANSLLNCSERINTAVTNLENIFNDMQANGWKGNTSTTFYSNYETYHEEMLELKKQVRDVYNAIMNTISDAQESLNAGETPL